jgi:hypothetical protein
VLSAWLSLVLAVNPCALPEGISVRELTIQVLPSSNAASAAPVSVPLGKLIARARVFNRRQDAEEIGATLSGRMALLEGFLSLCTLEEDQVEVLGTMLSLTLTAGELGKWEPARTRLEVAARRVVTAHARSARAHLFLAATLQLMGISAAGPAARAVAMTEMEAELVRCHELDPEFSCELKRGH